MDNIIKTKKSLENAGILIKRVSEIVKHQIKNKKVDFFGVFFLTLGASMLGNMLAGNGVMRAAKCEEDLIIRFIWVKSFNSALSFK